MTTKALIRYDGPALVNHQMDINDLAPDLLALGDLIRDCNHILNRKDTIRLSKFIAFASNVSKDIIILHMLRYAH